MYALLNRVAEAVGPAVRRSCYGYGVVFPQTIFDVRSVEWDPAIVIDSRSLQSRLSLEAALEDMIEFWRDRASTFERLSPPELRDVSQALRPDFERLPSLSIHASAVDAALDSLTAEQYELIDHSSDNDRLVCTGGAGTGKTFLAVEMARREADAGRRVGFVTSTGLQQSFVASRLGHPGVEVATPSSLGEPYDVLVIDEGQDVVNLDDLARLDQFLVGGLEHGRWRVFLDSNRQTGLVGRFDPEALEWLIGECHAFRTKLTRNCRNTRNIVTQTKLLTSADLGSPMAGDGPPVRFEYYDDIDTELALLEEELATMRGEGVAPGDITILSPLSFTESVASLCRPARRRRLLELDERQVRQWPCVETTFCTVPMFKGLENQFVLVVDITAIQELREVNELYVAMSRARTSLWMALPSHLKPELEQRSTTNLPAVLEDLAR